MEQLISEKVGTIEPNEPWSVGDQAFDAAWVVIGGIDAGARPSAHPGIVGDQAVSGLQGSTGQSSGTSLRGLDRAG